MLNCDHFIALAWEKKKEEEEEEEEEEEDEELSSYNC